MTKTKFLILFSLFFITELYTQRFFLQNSEFVSSYDTIENKWLKKNLIRLNGLQKKPVREQIESGMDKYFSARYNFLHTALDFFPWEIYERYYLNDIQLAEFYGYFEVNLKLNTTYFFQITLSLEKIGLQNLLLDKLEKPFTYSNE
ncbi:MAG: hypothetical protein PHR06_07240 [Candidatus Cloacimonetes bacterium]|nr:hypothetical protein [Candidatus Cloacimonadota bacterium]